MLKNELSEYIRNGENSFVEFKQDNVRPEQIAKELVAFANSNGGKLFIGVDDDGEISGIQRANLEPWIMDTICTRYINPSIIPTYEEVHLEDGLRVAVVTVSMGVSKPYVVKKKDKDDIYIRIGSISKLANREQIIRLSASGGLLDEETLAVRRTSLRNLDRARLENYFKDILQEPSMPKTDEEWQARLADMGFMTEGPTYSCTIAGLVLFGINPRRYFKQAGLRIMVFDSQDKEYKALLDVVLDGPMVARVNMAGQEILNIIDDGIIEKAATTLFPFITEESSTIDKGFRRPLKHLYPWNAIRELILNALAHRDWTRNIEIEICRYNDRLEVISPGALPNSMTVEKMIAGRRNTRNAIIMDVLRDYRYVDSRGMGIRTKVIPIMQKFNGTQPIFEATDDYLKTTLLFNGPKEQLHCPDYDPDDDLKAQDHDPNEAVNGLKVEVNDPKERVDDPNDGPNEIGE